MTILHVNKFYDLHGGAEMYLHQLMKRQRDRGHLVHVFSTHAEKNLPSDDAKRFVTLYQYNKSEGFAMDTKKAVNFLWNREAERAMRRTLEEVKPDVVHVHNIYHHLSVSVLKPIREANIPCVQTLHDYKVVGCANYMLFTEGSPCERCKGGKYVNAITHHCLSASFIPNVVAALEMGLVKARQADEKTIRLFLCPSRFMKEKMEDWGEPSGKLRHVPNPAELPVEMATGGGGYLLFAGRLTLEKGLASFLEAAAKVPELPVKIAGRGLGKLSVEEQIKSFARSKGAHHVEFLGFKMPDELRELRRRAEAVILPSIWYENSPLSLLEAMGHGLPCLTTRIGGNPELVEDGVNGFLAKPNDADDWLRVLRRFLATSDDVRRKMGLFGREKIEANHSWPQHLDRVDACYREAGAIG